MYENQPQASENVQGSNFYKLITIGKSLVFLPPVTRRSSLFYGRRRKTFEYVKSVTIRVVLYDEVFEKNSLKFFEPPINHFVLFLKNVNVYKTENMIHI